ncbi:hypothetical protein [Novosphingobium sp. PhB57]|uniref:hypothetical protein n=1 Tax=Novosphingobium sp. PhB57 TaxID=2485107 RepID=UPI001044FB35|nr:hypothetical protein [Novosphingobium sp. PhB57]
MTIELEMGALFAAAYNTDLMEVGSLACAAWRDQDKHPEMLELRNGIGQLLDLIPADTEPQTAAIACRLYAAGCVEACETGTASAWTSRRSPIGAAAKQSPKSCRFSAVRPILASISSLVRSRSCR